MKEVTITLSMEEFRSLYFGVHNSNTGHIRYSVKKQISDLAKVNGIKKANGDKFWKDEEDDMLFGSEVKIREAHNSDWTTIVKEIKCRDEVYCRTNVKFHASDIIHEPFEELCKRLGATELQPVCPKCGAVYFREARDVNNCAKCSTSFDKKGERID